MSREMLDMVDVLAREKNVEKSAVSCYNLPMLVI